MKHLFRSAASSVITGIDTLLLRPWFKHTQSIILQGHFYPESAGFEKLELSRTLPYLKNHFEIVNVSDNLARFNSRKSKPLLSFAIDDFGEGFTEHSYPYFKKYDIPFTLGVCPGLFASIRSDLPVVYSDQISKNSQANFKTDSVSDLKDIIAEHPVEICSHTMSHVLLSQMNQNQKEFEITESKKLLEQISGMSVKGFIYPFGYEFLINKTHTNILKNAGYQYAISTENGVVRPDQRWGIKRMNADVDYNATRVNATFLWAKLKES